jgi:acetyltransferase-like isoleucine patch superfamily enzyme/glycosyltransferase involved in cell wall biosynthesis
MHDQLIRKVHAHSAWADKYPGHQAGHTEPDPASLDVYRLSAETRHALGSHGILLEGDLGGQECYILLRRTRQYRNLCIVLHGYNDTTIVLGDGDYSGILKIEGCEHVIVFGDTPYHFVLTTTLRRDKGAVFIGQNGLSNGVDILVEGQDNFVSFGDDVQIGESVLVRTSDSHGIVTAGGEPVFLNPPRSVTIGTHVWLGARSVVQRGTTIGAGSIVALGAIVTENVPPKALFAGVPASLKCQNVTWTRSSQPSKDDIVAARGLAASQTQSSVRTAVVRQPGPAPIFIMSFNRPEYLAHVIRSLLEQDKKLLADQDIYLAQDGAVNPLSGQQYADQKTIAECVSLFTSAFPEGKVLSYSANLGVALNFDRCERIAFEDLRAEYAVFLEDDLVLAPHYLATLESLVNQFRDDARVGYVSAYGNHTHPLDEQKRNKDKLVVLTHNWGFAVFRRQWIKMRSKVLEYLDIVRASDYNKRDEAAIQRLFASWGYGMPASSQDAAKTIACCSDKVIKINTYICNAAYIGARGLHMTPQMFTERGYDKTEMFAEAVTEFEPLSDGLYRQILREQESWAQHVSRRHI